MSHDHNHGDKNLKLAFFLNVGFTVIELIGGLYVNSIAIISDALHDFGDSLSLGMAWWLGRKAQSGEDEKFSYGYKRFSLLGALINSVVLITGSVYVIYAAINRIIHPEHSDAEGMMIFAIFGVLVNGYAAWKVSSGKTLNERVVSWHLFEDVLGWVAILIVSIIFKFKDIHFLDPLLSLLITLFILWNVFKRLNETFRIFLQAVPDNLVVNDIKLKLKNIDFVEDVHHVHIWSLDGEHNVFTTHLKTKNITNINEYNVLKSKVNNLLEDYGFGHTTIEIEVDSSSCSMVSTFKEH